jgi:hypothetical protein
LHEKTPAKRWSVNKLQNDATKLERQLLAKNLNEIKNYWTKRISQKVTIHTTWPKRYTLQTKISVGPQAKNRTTR